MLVFDTINTLFYSLKGDVLSSKCNKMLLVLVVLSIVLLTGAAYWYPNRMPPFFLIGVVAMAMASTFFLWSSYTFYNFSDHALSHYDPLTNLYNRRALERIFKKMIARNRRNNTKLALFFLDIDNFKEVNDCFGHDVGDKLLRGITLRLQEVIRNQDVIGRIGGDEFVILMDELKNSEEAYVMAERMREAFCAPVNIDHHTLGSTFSIGISIYPDNASDYESMLKAADSAMYQAKQNGKNQYQFYNAILDAKIKSEIELKNALKLALHNNEFVLHYQPKMALGNSNICEAEALLRWQRHDGTLHMPAAFLAQAEQSGIIVDIGKWVITTVCQEIAVLAQQGVQCRIAINLSSVQIRDTSLVEHVRYAIAFYQIDPGLLEFEFSESLLLSEYETASKVMQQLERVGVCLSVDEFGRGFTVMGYLTRLPIQKIKIDRSMMNDARLNSKHNTLLHALVALGHQLNLSITTEGIEVDAQLAASKELRADAAQGYYYARPMEAGAFEMFMKSERYAS